MLNRLFRKLMLHPWLGKKILMMLLGTNIVYAVMVLYTGPKLAVYSPLQPILDLCVSGYDAPYVEQLFGTLGDAGRKIYLYEQLPADMLYPLLSSITYCASIAYLLTKMGKLESNWRYLCYAPLFCGVFDYFENFGILTMLATYPNFPLWLPRLSSLFTQTKFAFGIGYFSIILLLLMGWGLHMFMHKNTHHSHTP